MSHDPAQGESEGLRRSWDAASTSMGTTERAISMAGLVVRVRAAGTAVLDALWPALSHHPTTGAPADLTLHLWDLGSSGAPRPEPPAALFTDDAMLRHYVDVDELRIRLDPDSRMLVAFDQASGTAWCCIDDIGGIAWWEQAAPLRWLFAWWLESEGHPMLHAAAVGDEQGAVLLAGPGGSGKSTSALAAAMAGMGYVGDDYTAISFAAGPTVHSVYATAKLRLDDHDPEGPLAPHLLRASPRPDDKAVVAMNRVPGVAMMSSAPVVAVVAVRVSPAGVTRVTSMSRGQALAALAPSTILQLHGTGARAFSGLSSLVRQVPVATLEVGADRDEVVGAVKQLATGSLVA